MTAKLCVYTKDRPNSNAYGTRWDTECGNKRYIEAPMEVGFASAPLPNEYAKFCPYCGNVIEIKEPK